MEQEKKRTRPRVMAVGSGKGGVGKTIIAANLALSMAQCPGNRGKRIIAVDLDLGCGNLNTCLGVRLPDSSINDFLFGRVGDLRELLVPTCFDNLKLISCSYRGSEIIQLEDGVKRKLEEQIANLPADIVVLDLGGGVAPDVLDFFRIAQDRIVVTTAESLALHNAFLFLKSAIYRSLGSQLEAEPFLQPIQLQLNDVLSRNGGLTVERLLEHLKTWDRYSSYIVAGMLGEMRYKLILNMFRGGPEERYLGNFCNLVRKYLYLRGNIEYLGAVEYEEKVRSSTQGLEPFLLGYPATQAAINIRRIAELLTDTDGRPAS